MTRDELLERVITRARADERVLCLLLGGSLGRGEGDAWSDLDLIAVVAPADHGGFFAGARSWLEAAASLIHVLGHPPGVPILTVVTVDWLRCDLTVTVPGHFPGAKGSLRVLHDPAGLAASLPDELPPGAFNAAAALAIVGEFIRVLGLSTVAAGREEWLTAVTGFGLLRGQLIALMIEQLALPYRPGALRLNPLLPARDLALLQSLPAPIPERGSVLSANNQIAGLFIPRAREALQGDFPEVLWDRTQAHLARELGPDWRLVS